MESTDWTAALEMETVKGMAKEFAKQNQGEELRVLVLYGSLRER